MSELNPHIVKEHEGDYENTIQYFVTGRPLAEEEMLPDSHGVRPVSPLGFMMREDGAILVPTEPLSGFSAYPVVEEGGHVVTAQEAYEASYKVTGKYYMFDSDAISFPVLNIHRSNDRTGLVITLNGLVPVLDSGDSVFFRNMTTDDYTPTGLVGENAEFTPDSITPDPGTGTTVVRVTTGIPFDGTVTEGKLAMCVRTVKKFLTVEDPESDTWSGIYVLGESEGEPIRKAFNWYGPEVGEPGNNDTPCYASNGYSDTEVEHWVSGKMGSITHHGCHPSGEAGDLRDAGALVTWFATCGDVDISGGAGNNAVIVPGFGLGYGYYNMCAGEPKSSYRPDPDDSSERKWLTFGYGAKHDAYDSNVGKTALPLDWPFSNSSSFADETRDSNITLIKDGVLFDDGINVPRTVGGLTRMSRECHVCNGSGVVIEDGRTRPCRNCGATGEEPDCETCGGTGIWTNPDTGEEEICPACNGVGFCGGHRYVMDKVHVCLYNDFKTSDTAHGHEAGTTVLKKTFVNLATPITQKDGDSFEVTVSLPNTGMDEAYTGSMMQNLSGYYAYVSQPRVYVVSGTWDFSDTKVQFATKDFIEYDLGGTPFRDKDGNALPPDTAVRVKLLFDAYRGKRFSVTGKLADGNVVLDESPDIPANLMRKIRKSADADGNIHGSICGAAYVEPNNDTLSPAIKTNLGLNAVRNANGALGVDYGEGGPGSLQQYNKLYTADTESSDRQHVLFEGSDVPRKDQRQIVATVYPTVTNTFPWALTHRRKLGFLDKLMTMEADAGVDGMFARIYRMNRDIFHSIPMESPLEKEYYPLDMYGDAESNFAAQTVERDRLSVIGALVTVVGNLDEVSSDVDAQPVRRALQAAGMLAADYRNSRVSRLGSIGGSSGVSAYVAGTNIRADGSEVATFDDLGTLVGITARNEYESMANAVRLRHLPVILASAGSDPLTAEPKSDVLASYPYADSRYAYYSGNPYGYGDYDTTSRTEEIPCEVASATGNEAWCIKNSIVEACVSRTVTDPDMVDELYRSAELHAIDLSDIDDILQPQVYRDGNGRDISWLDAIDAFTKIISPDNIPVPSISGIDYVHEFASKEAQLPFIMGDAYGYYKTVNSLDWHGVTDNFIATTMPTDDSLAMFLKEYVPSYGARLAVRNWDSFRTKVEAGAHPSGDSTYLTRMRWYDRECSDSASRGIYASDAFIVGTGFSDVNLNRIEFANDDDALSLNCSVPPYSVKPGYNTLAPFATENDPYSVSYVRVFMKFVFSEDAGRWYCVDYRQAPVSYLSPLYGAQALERSVEGKRLWVRPACDNTTWEGHLLQTYEEYRPLDINPELVRAVMEKDGDGNCRLMFPYLPVDEGGLGLNAPVHKDGSATAEDIQAMPHANFWSVREHLRPATGTVAAGDIPRYYKDGDEWKWSMTGGIMSDSVLWGQYDYPAKDTVEYHLPDTDIPDADLSQRILVYAQRNAVTGLMDTGDIQAGPNPDSAIAVSYGAGRE